MRQKAWIGVVQRRHSSTASGSSDGIGGQRGPLVRVLGQGQGPTGQEAAGGLVAGDHERQAEHLDLLGRERHVADLRGGQQGQQVVAGGREALAHVAVEETANSMTLASTSALGLSLTSMVASDQRRRTAGSWSVMPEEVGDDRHRDRRGDALHEVDVVIAPRAGRRRRGRDRGPHGGLHPGDGPRGELAVEQLAVVGVHRRVEVQERPRRVVRLDRRARGR